MRATAFLLTVLASLACQASRAADIRDQIRVQGRGSLILSNTEASHGGMRPWFAQGAGQLALRSSKLALSPQSLALAVDLTDTITAHSNAEYHHASETGTEITEAWFSWQPLPFGDYRLKLRAGWFYPALSLENTDIAWTSPYSNNFSMVNSWFAEELRANAIETSISRKFSLGQAPLTLQWVGALARGNDPLGAIISWRGFAIHNLQTGLHERIDFANYPTLQQPPLSMQPSWVEPFRELDGHTGFYTGMHLLFDDSTELRVYHYDNQADPTVFAKGQYAWHTQFDHLAVQQQLSENVRVVAQWLRGDTMMGDDAVYMDYQAWFALVSYNLSDWQLSWRYDSATQEDEDNNKLDDNSGRARSWTANLAYRLSEHWQLALEFTELRSHQPNRAQWPRWPVDHQEQVGSLLVTWRID